MNKYDRKHLANVRYYQWLMGRIFQEAAKDGASMAAGMTAPDGEIFSFDDYPRTKIQIAKLQAQMAARMQLVVVDGIEAEWALSNEKNDALVDEVLAESARQAKYYRSNIEARDAFIQRKEGGLSLSDRVWKYSEQFKEEIEMGIDCGLREGLDAPAMARQLKQYLQHPDKLFRRVRDEHGNLKLSQRAAAFHPGKGVYRSSYKNARRLSATETNMAYRSADYERWQQLDFIVGIEVHLSNNHTCLGKDGKPHPFYDICDELKGKYPKDFKFTGWHPHCRCIATTITKTEAEMDADDEAILRGEQPSDPDTSANAVTELPDNFKQWVEDNEDRIARAKSKPYFLRDNDALINPPEPTQKESALSILDKAVAAGYLPKESVAKLRQIAEQGDTELFERRASTLQAVAERHATRTKGEKDAIKQMWNDRKVFYKEKDRLDALLGDATGVKGLDIVSQTVADNIAKAAKKKYNYHAIERLANDVERKLNLVKKGAENVAKVAADYGEMDASQLLKLLNAGKLDYAAIQKATRALGGDVLAMKRAEQALEDVIPNVHEWHKQFTLAELQGVKSAVNSTTDTWLSKYGYKSWDAAPNLHKKAKLEYEISELATSKKYPTWEVAREAYRKKLAIVEEAIEFDGFKTKWQEFKDFAKTSGTYSTKYKENVKKLANAIMAKDKTEAKILIAELEQHKAKLSLKYAGKGSQAGASISTTSTNNTLQSGHVPFQSSYDEQIKEIMRQTGADKATAEKMFKGVNGFTYQWDYEIRQVQCGNPVTSRHGHTHAEIVERATYCERYIADAPQWDGGTTYRGMSLSPKELDEARRQLQAGTYDNRGSASWSSTESVSRGFSGYHINKTSPVYGDIKTERVVLVMKGHHKKATSIRYISEFASEDEVLASMSCRYRLVREYQSRGITYFEVEDVK